MRWLTCILLTGACATALAQHLTVTGYVRDAWSQEPLSSVRVKQEGERAYTLTNDSGYFSIQIKVRPAINLIFSKTGYRALNYTWHHGGVQANILLERDYTSLAEVEVGAARVEWSSRQLHVADYTFLEKGLLLLTCEKEDLWKRQNEAGKTYYSGCRLILLDTLGNELGRLTVPGQAEALYDHYPGIVFLLTRFKIFAITFEEGRISLEETEQQFFEERIKPVEAIQGQRVVYSNFNPDYPAFDFKIFNQADSSVITFYHAEDEWTMEVFRSEFKYLHPRDKLTAYRYEMKYGVDKEIVAAYMRDFQHSNYYRPLNVPLLAMGNEYLLFDHTHHKMLVYDTAGSLKREAPINYHISSRPLKWHGCMLADTLKGRLYTTYQSNEQVILAEVDSVNGNTSRMQRLYFPYASKVKVHNGRVYYTYRPFESAQKHYLYSEKVAE